MARYTGEYLPGYVDVLILRCSKAEWWYTGKVGQIFTVNTHRTRGQGKEAGYSVLDRGSCWIAHADCIQLGEGMNNSNLLHLLQDI
jgi:hypothetical protein